MEILELKSTITEMKNSLEGLNSRFDQAEVRIHESGHRSTEMIQSVKQKRKRIKKNEQRLKHL